jgi:hypothetical protein
MSGLKKHRKWLWPLGLAAAGVGAAGTILLRGCWHTSMSWPVRYDEQYSYRVCTDCGAKRLFDHQAFREYGPYGYDLPKLIARDRDRKIKKLHKLSA